MTFKCLSSVLIGVLLSSNVSYAQESTDANTQPQLSFSIKPVTCVVKSQGEQCEMKARVTWQVPESLDICLFQDDKSLSCWKKRSKVDEFITVKLSKTMVFSLKNSQQETVLEQTVKVHAMNSQKYRRKLKSNWSLF